MIYEAGKKHWLGAAFILILIFVATASILRSEHRSGIDKDTIRTFEILDREDNGINFDKDNEEYKKYVDQIEQFLSTPKSWSMSDTEILGLSPNLKVFPFANGRVITYEPNPQYNGLLNSGIFTFLQNFNEQNDVTVIRLYMGTTKHIQYVFKMEDDFLIVAGEDMEFNPYYAFMDGFVIKGKTATLISVLPDYRDDNWDFRTDTGLIFSSTGNHDGTSIESADAKSILLKSTNGSKIALKYESAIEKYQIDKIN